MSVIGDRVRKARIALGLTQEELAKIVGYNGRAAINKIEQGKSNPSMEYIVRLADALDLSPSWLLGTEEDQKKDTLEKAFNERPEMRTLFSVAEDCSKEEIEQAIKIIEALKK